jgi:hypothetical protein
MLEKRPRLAPARAIKKCWVLVIRYRTGSEHTNRLLGAAILDSVLTEVVVDLVKITVYFNGEVVRFD